MLGFQRIDVFIAMGIAGLVNRLSFGIPFALVPLVLLTRRPDVMGALANRGVTTAVASVVAMLIIALNGFLLFDTFIA